VRVLVHVCVCFLKYVCMHQHCSGDASIEHTRFQLEAAARAPTEYATRFPSSPRIISSVPAHLRMTSFRLCASRALQDLMDEVRYGAWGRMVCGCDVSTDTETGLGATKRDSRHGLRGGLFRERKILLDR
jgi:hypothetical protein